MIYILDASAMIALARNENGAKIVEDILFDPANLCLAHSLNLCEVYYDFHRSNGKENALAVIDGLRRNGVRERSDCHQPFWEIVGELKSRLKRVSLADCFAIALALQSGGTLLTCDHHEFDRIAEEGVCPLLFVR